MASSNGPPATEDQIQYDVFVDRAVDLVESGVVEMADLETKPHHEATNQQFRHDVAEELGQSLQDDEADDEPETSDDNSDPHTVDWASLWEEFGFDTPDAAGLEIISDTQLRMALETTEQTLQGDIEGHIRSGVTQTAIVERRTDGGTLRGYTHVEGSQ